MEKDKRLFPFRKCSVENFPGGAGCGYSEIIKIPKKASLNYGKQIIDF